MESHLLYVGSAYSFAALVLFLFSAKSYFSNIRIKSKLNKVDKDLSEKL